MKTRTVIGHLAVTGAMFLLAGCAGHSASLPPPAAAPPSTSTTPAPPPSPAPPPVTPPPIGSADGSDPSSVSRVVIECMYEIDTTRDSGFAAGLRRAADLLTPEYAASVSSAPTPSPDARWREYTAHQAYTEVSLTDTAEDHPVDTATTAHREWLVSYTPVGRDGWRGTPVQSLALVTLTHAAGGWVVSQIDNH
jgi:hypothetical protein